MLPRAANLARYTREIHRTSHPRPTERVKPDTAKPATVKPAKEMKIERKKPSVEKRKQPVPRVDFRVPLIAAQPVQVHREVKVPAAKKESTQLQRRRVQKHSSGSGHEQRRYYSANSGKSSSRQIMEVLDREPTASIKDKLLLLAIAGGMALLAYQLYKDNFQEPVLDDSVMKGDNSNVKDLSVVSSTEIKSAGHKVLAGRSHGHKVVLENEHGEHRYYYYKEPFSREGLIRELILGALGKKLLGDEFPKVYAVETPVDANRSRYGVMSESLGTNVRLDNLETWAEMYDEDEEEINFGPAHLGEALAFDKLFGKTDSKLANLIVKRDHHGNCYSIDNESGFNMAPTFIADAAEAVSFIGEFRSKTFIEHSMEQQNDIGLDTNENIHQPLKANKIVKDKVEPIFRQAVKNDLENGRVIAFYEKFASLSENDFNDIFNQFGSLIHEDERKLYLADLKERQAATRKYLQEYKTPGLCGRSAYQDVVSTISGWFGLRK